MQLFKTPSFLVLLLVWGSASGMFNALLTILPQLLCPYGYSDQETGLWASLMIFSGMIGAMLGGVLLDHSKLFKEVAVVSYSLAILSFIWFYEVFSVAGQKINIAFSLSVFGFFALPLIPACMELGVEITYPVSEVTSSGLLWSAAQVMSIVIVLVGGVFQFPLSDDLVTINACGGTAPNPNDTSVPECFHPSSNKSVPIPFKDGTPLYDPEPTILFCLVIISINFLFLTICLWPKYKRLESEKRDSFEKSVHVKK